MALTPNGLVTISGSPANGEQPTQNAGATMVDGVIVPTAGFIGIGSGAAQVDSEVFGVNGVSVFGNVGIGVSPNAYANGDSLVIGDGSVDSLLQLNASTTGSCRIRFGDGTGADAFRGYLLYGHSTDYFAFATAGVEAIRIDNGQALLVATTSSPSAGVKLSVNGGVKFGSLPTSDPGVAGELWNDAGTVKISL